MNKTSKDINDIKRITIVVDYQTWEDFRQISFDNKISMNKLVKEFIAKYINKHTRNDVDK